MQKDSISFRRRVVRSTRSTIFPPRITLKLCWKNLLLVLRDWFVLRPVAADNINFEALPPGQSDVENNAMIAKSPFWRDIVEIFGRVCCMRGPGSASNLTLTFKNTIEFRLFHARE